MLLYLFWFVTYKPHFATTTPNVVEDTTSTTHVFISKMHVLYIIL